MVTPSDVAPNIAAIPPIDYTDAIINQLWRPDAEGGLPSVFAILDGARDKRIEPMVRNSGLENDCLFTGVKSYALLRAAPHIVKLDPLSSFTHKIIGMGWGNAWGIFAIGTKQCQLPQVRHRFRRIARAKSPTGKTILFRYYDPRVMRAYLPTCRQSEIEYIYGPLTSIMMEHEDSHSILEFKPAKNGPPLVTSQSLS